MARRYYALLVGLAGLATAGCSSRKLDYETIDTSDLAAERFTTYRRAGDTIVVSRVSTSKAAGSQLLSYAIWNTGRAGTMQQVRSRKQLREAQLDSVHKQLTRLPGYWTPETGEQELFVQIRPPKSEGDDLSVLSLRQEVEDEIDVALTTANIGHWTAGDLGPGGGNMLFSTTDTDRAQRAILTVLRAYKLDHHAVVARRVMTAPDDWQYEVFYPAAYSGLFNSM